MKVSVELFLLDNTLMNFLVLRLAAALVGKRLRFYVVLPASLVGALYALLSMTVAPFLLATLPKLLFGAALAFVLRGCGGGYLKCLLSLYLSAFLLGGMMLALAMLFGGEVAGGVLMGTVPLRVLLLTAALFAVLPRVARALMSAYRHRTRHVRLRVELSDRVFVVWALVDSGNLLTEPVSGLPVVVLRTGLLPPDGGRPVPYASMGAEGCLYAVRPRRMCVYTGEWMEIDAFAAEADGSLGAEEAVIGANLLQEERRALIDSETQDAAWEAVSPDTPARQERTHVHPLGRDAAHSVQAGGGDGVDREAHAGR